jgi:hypothetical protein
MSCCCEKLVAEARESSSFRSRYLATASEALTVDSTMCVCDSDLYGVVMHQGVQEIRLSIENLSIVTLSRDNIYIYIYIIGSPRPLILVF